MISTETQKIEALKKLYASFDRKDLPGGYAVAIIDSGKVIFKRGYGFASHEDDIAFTSQTQFDFASLAKQFTGYCVATLVKENSLAVEDDIRDYIQELPDYGHRITIGHLLGHTSGLRDWFHLAKLTGRSENDTITAEFLMKLTCRQQELNFIPGSRFAYSNTGYFLLAELIHRVTGKTLRAYADQKIFNPLGMKNSFFGDDVDEIIPNRAMPYMENAKHQFGQGANRLAAAGSSSLFSTLDDIVRWMQHFDQAVSQGDDIFDIMRQPTLLNNGKSVSYNYGIMKARWRGHIFMGHGGSWNGFACDAAFFPEEKISIIFLTNRSPNYVNTHNPVRCILLDEAEETKTAVGDTNQNVQELPQPELSNTSEYSGEYYSQEIQAIYSLHTKKDKLTLEHLVNEDVTLTPVEPDRCKGNQYWCEEVCFTRDAAGRVDGFLVSADSGNLIQGLRFKKL